jgi:hypothetical protein
MNLLIFKIKLFIILLLILNWSIAFSQISDVAHTAQEQPHKGFNYPYVRERSDSLNDPKLSLYIKKERRNSMIFTVSSLITSSVVIFVLANDNMADRSSSIALSIPVSVSLFSFVNK